MTEAKYPDDWPDIDTVLYDRSVKVFRSVKRLLGVNIELHAESQPEQGDIFLFNHFSRFETFVPQFLIYQRTGAYSCAIASSQFFEQDTALARYLKSVGVFPHDHPRLFPMLAAQILRGRKVIIFPEGGMVKDRDVMDAEGHYSVFSRTSGKRRKHHTGPAVLAQGLEAFKTTVRNAYCNKEHHRLLQWQEELHLDGLDRLLMAALKPTLIVPANITFYPIRSSQNWLQQGVELFAERLTPRQTEELLIEGNILLKETDMDVRMGKPVNPCAVWHWWNRYVLDWLAPNFTSLDKLFALHSAPGSLKQRLLGRYFRKCANATRDQYMADIYALVTVNLSHLASSLIMDCIAKGQRKIGKERFYTALYIAVRRLQEKDRINLHRSLNRCDEYIDLIDGRSRRFEHFICLAKESALLTEDAHHYHFEEKLCAEYDLDAIRLENLIAVYCNEVAPVRDVREVLGQSLQDCDRLDRARLAAWRLEDEHRALAEERRHYQAPRFDDINRLESADADPSPFFLQPEQSGNAGILLIHGLLASPAEVRDYGEHLVQQGYTVLAVRLKGHGTSPYALRDQRWEDWYASVRRGFNILRLFCDRITAVGFSTGGALALKLAAERGQEMAGVVALSLPIKFNNPAFRLLPLLHRTNRVVEWVSTYDGVKPFIQNATEHPHINYTHVPVRSLDQLRQLIEHLDGCLPGISIPALIIYGDQDPVVSPKSAAALMDRPGPGGVAEKRGGPDGQARLHP
ncbi:MAG: alpha/beta fold hydrolase [Methylotetracoccus sp.]|nr:alpha/beta fold hydrolase [Methylotetracoccus sp.]